MRRLSQREHGRLQRITIPSEVDSRSIPAEVHERLSVARDRIEAFQDRWDQPQIEQYVAADLPLVYQTLGWVLETQLVVGNRFLEWGCGFAVVASLASTYGLDVVGIEAEPRLLEQAKRLIRLWESDVELVEGNFLPPGAESLADDPLLPSLGHQAEVAYPLVGLDLCDFAIVYGYPWPGEEWFHRAVFERYGGTGALLMQFCGPNDIQLFRKTTRAR